MTSRYVLALSAWCIFSSFILQAARARFVTVEHSDLTQIEYYPIVCVGSIDCKRGCESWWLSKNDCFKNRGSSAHSTKSPGSSLRFNFTGTEISLVVNARGSGARAILELDGAHEAEVSTIADHLTVNSVAWRKTGLTNSPHSLVLTYDPTSFSPSDDRFLHIVGFQYTIPETGTPSVVTDPNQMPVATTESSNSTVASAPPNLIGIVVGVIGGVGLLIALIVGFYFGRRWDRQRKLQNSALPTVAPLPPPPPRHMEPYMYREQPMQHMPIQPTFLNEPPPPPRYPRRWTTMSDLSSAVSIGRTDITSYYDEKSPLKAQFYDDRQRLGSPPPDDAL